jgi:hypothetical protein
VTIATSLPQPRHDLARLLAVAPERDRIALPEVAAAYPPPVPTGAGRDPYQLVRDAADRAGLGCFIDLATRYPTLAQGIALPLVALLIMAVIMGGPAMIVVGAYFIGCGMILARKAVQSIVDNAPDRPHTP